MRPGNRALFVSYTAPGATMNGWQQEQTNGDWFNEHFLRVTDSFASNIAALCVKHYPTLLCSYMLHRNLGK